MKLKQYPIKESVPKLYLKIMAVKKDIKRLEDERKKLVEPWKKETDSKKKQKIQDQMKKLTVDINKRVENIHQMEKMEDEFGAGFNSKSTAGSQQAKRDMKGEFDESMDDFKSNAQYQILRRGMEDMKGINESDEEPKVIQDLRSIIKHKQNNKVKDPVSGNQVKVDLFSASAIVQVYDAINDSNKKKYVTASISKMASMAFKLMK